LLGRGDDGKERQSNSDLQLNKSPKKRKNGKDRGWGRKKKKKQRSQMRKTGVPRPQESKNQRIEDAISESKERNSVGAVGLQLRGLGRRG